MLRKHRLKLKREREAQMVFPEIPYDAKVGAGMIHNYEKAQGIVHETEPFIFKTDSLVSPETLKATHIDARIILENNSENKFVMLRTEISE